LRQNVLRQREEPDLGLPNEAVSRPESECGCRVITQTHVGPAPGYNEEAFQYFLADEEKRKKHSAHASLLVLVDFEPAMVTPERDRLHRLQAAFSRLSLCLRETDIVGWYRQGRVVGAVLTDVADPIAPETVRLIEQRIGDLLHGDGISPSGVRVRVFPLSARSIRASAEELR
jgi:hypothetical protein